MTLTRRMGGEEREEGGLTKVGRNSSLILFHALSLRRKRQATKQVLTRCECVSAWRITALLLLFASYKSTRLSQPTRSPHTHTHTQVVHSYNMDGRMVDWQWLGNKLTRDKWSHRFLLLDVFLTDRLCPPFLLLHCGTGVLARV